MKLWILLILFFIFGTWQTLRNEQSTCKKPIDIALDLNLVRNNYELMMFPSI